VDRQNNILNYITETEKNNMYSFFVIWNFLFVISIILIFFRSDAKELFIELCGMVIHKDLWSFILSMVIIYTMFPLTIIHSLINIWNRL
jgi:hypothetical protein